MNTEILDLRDLRDRIRDLIDADAPNVRLWNLCVDHRALRQPKQKPPKISQPQDGAGADKRVVD